MRRLADFRRFSFVILLVLLTANLWGQDPTPAALSGSGTYADPYKISSAANWDAFATAVNGGYEYLGEYVKLTADITTSTIVGVWNEVDTLRKIFKGNFEGNNKTLTFNKTCGAEEDFLIAPFMCIRRDTIRNLNVQGTITTSVNGAAGLIGYCDEGNAYVENVTVSITINASEKQNCGGFAINGRGLTFKSCMYNGQIVTGTNSAGFCGTGSVSTNVIDCFFKPATGSSVGGGDNFANGEIGTVLRSYYTEQIGTSTQGYKAYVDNPGVSFNMKKTLKDGNDYFVDGQTDTNLESDYYIVDDVVNLGLVVAFEGTVLTKDSDYTVAIYKADGESFVLVTDCNSVGTYKLTITGNGTTYYNSLTTDEFHVLSADSNAYQGGDGTMGNPYQIATKDQWEYFASQINSGYGLSAYYKLLANIGTESSPVSAIAGTSSNKFSGTFDGNGKTLHFSKTSTAEGCAPFGYINGATIKNLIVEGTINVGHKYAGGFVGNAYGACTISNSTSKINLNCSTIEGDHTCGGFVGEAKSGASMTFEHCLFEGNIVDTRSPKKATKLGGFLGFADKSNGNVYYTECFMVGVIDVLENVGTFHRGGKNTANINRYDCRRLADYDNGNDSGPLSIELSQDIVYIAEVANGYSYNGKTYYAPRSVFSGLKTIVYNNDDPVVLTPYLSYFGKEMVSGKDYTVDIKKKDGSGEYTIVPDPYIIQTVGAYKVTIKGISESGFFGSEEKKFSIIEPGTGWAKLQSDLDDASKPTITLDANYIAPEGSEALTINRNVTINLAGYDIDRNLSEATLDGRVIKIAKGCTVTINGPGVIAGGYNKAKNESTSPADNDGGGIYNMGNLTLNNVTVSDNKCIKKTTTSTAATGRAGGIYTGDGSSFTMRGGALYYNQAEGGGGGIFVNKAASFTIQNEVYFYGNSSKDKGAGIRMEIPNNKTYVVSNSYFIANTATDKKNSEGGGIYLKGGSNSLLRLDACSFVYNSAYSKGGAFFSINGTTYAKDCTMENNLSFDQIGVVGDKSYGGAIYLHAGGSDKSVYTMDGGSITNSGAITSGGAVYVANGATFNILGNIQIHGCSVYSGDDNIDNNVQLNGSSAVNVIGDLGENSIISITPSSNGSSPIITGLEDNGSISNFVIDNNDTDQGLSMDPVTGAVIVYNPANWNESATWNNVYGTNTTTPNSVPGSTDNITINRIIIIPSGYVAQAGSITLTDEPGTKGEIIIKDGGQLITNTTNVDVLARKDVAAAVVISPDEPIGWYLISSPVNNTSIENNTNLITPKQNNTNTYDLYRFNESAAIQWENYRAHSTGAGANFTTLENGRGYLYRNADAHTIEIGGTLNVDNIFYNLSCSGSELTGFNLIGNPYSQNITLLNTTLVDNDNNQIEDGEHNPINLVGFYRLTNNGSAWTSEITSGDEATIAPMEGFLVQVPEAAKKVKFSKTPRAAKRSIGDHIMFTIANNQYEDVAYALFEKGLGLNKIEHMNEDVPMVYINRNEEDFAIATLNDEVKQFNLNFEAKTTGKYTLKVEKTGTYSYLHLIDKVAEKDINLLEENEYSFVGSPADKADRFIVRLELSEDAENLVFAYQSGDEIIVSGEGELQVFDVMGRLVMQKHVSGVESIATPMTTGVYILRLNDKTQKIIIK